MSGTIALHQKDVYGAFELKRLYPKNFARGLAAAILLHMLLIGFYYIYQATIKEDIQGIVKPVQIPYTEIEVPPINIPIQTPSSAHVAPLTNAIPVPVPADQVSPDQIIPTQDQLSHQTSNATELSTDNAKVIVDINTTQIPKGPDPDPGTFYPCEKFPEMVVAGKLEYPEVARRSGITGRVFVKILVDNEGKPKKAFVYKTDSDLFNQAAIDAAMKSVFTPAIQNQHPIAVWIVLPYRFQLQEQ